MVPGIMEIIWLLFKLNKVTFSFIDDDKIGICRKGKNDNSRF